MTFRDLFDVFLGLPEDVPWVGMLLSGDSLIFLVQRCTVLSAILVLSLIYALDLLSLQKAAMTAIWQGVSGFPFPMWQL